jgi:transposase
MLQPVVRRTWAPKGHTPIHKSWDRRERLSVASAITVSPRRRRLTLHFAVHDHNIVHEDFETFASNIMRRVRGRMILVVDRWSVHRAGARRLLARFAKRLQIEWLPPYAPDLNPVEQVWGRAKYTDLANYIPEEIGELGRAVRWSLRRTRARQTLLRSFFQHAKLKL